MTKKSSTPVEVSPLVETSSGSLLYTADDFSLLWINSNPEVFRRLLEESETAKSIHVIPSKASYAELVRSGELVLESISPT